MGTRDCYHRGKVVGINIHITALWVYAESLIMLKKLQTLLNAQTKT